jgi:hypothetical protein
MDFIWFSEQRAEVVLSITIFEIKVAEKHGFLRCLLSL